MITVIDCDMGNVRSVLNMLKKIGCQARITSDLAEIRAATALILPGVGSFDHGMFNLAEKGMIPVLREKVLAGGTPFLGICLGMQLLTKQSEEGSREGLGWVEASTVRFVFPELQPRPPVPHMGWNTVVPGAGEGLFRGLEGAPRFYFVHSYHVSCERDDLVIGTTGYGRPFVSALRKGNIVGTQFHPEKSHRFGMTLLRNFVADIG